MLLTFCFSILLLGLVHLSSSRPIHYPQRRDNNGGVIGGQAVLSANFPDPSIIEVDGVWYAFATSDGNRNVQAASSPDFSNPAWVLRDDVDVLPQAGSWAANDNVWAPHVMQLDDNQFVMYYAAPVAGNPNFHCVGAATSTSILGPYAPTAEAFACPLSQGGAIDPAGFIDPRTGNMYVVYKVDGNSLNTGGGPCNGPGPDGYHATPIMLQQVSRQDGITLIGEPFEILDRDANDGPLVEAPSLFYSQQDDQYILTFSSNCYYTDLYDISSAYSTNLESRFTKSSQSLLTTSTGPVRAPGGAAFTPDGKYALFHGTVSNDGSNLIRYLYAAEAQVDVSNLAVALVS